MWLSLLIGIFRQGELGWRRYFACDSCTCSFQCHWCLFSIQSCWHLLEQTQELSLLVGVQDWWWRESQLQESRQDDNGEPAYPLRRVAHQRSICVHSQVARLWRISERVRGPTRYMGIEDLHQWLRSSELSFQFAHEEAFISGHRWLPHVSHQNWTWNQESAFVWLSVNCCMYIGVFRSKA